MRLSAMRSMTACDSRRVVVEAELSPVAIAFLTFLIAVRIDYLRLALRWRVASAWRARLRACAELAMKSDPCSRTTPRSEASSFTGWAGSAAASHPGRKPGFTGERGSGGAALKDRA